jgi:molecular chaperone GrpE (heat shock protein)
MNNARRKELAKVQDELIKLQERLQEIAEEEEGYRDNLPENMQDGEKYEKANAACDDLSAAVDALEEAISNIEDACE